MDLELYERFLAGYGGEDTDDARLAYRALIAEADADADIADAVGPYDARVVNALIARMLNIAVRIGYRYQAMSREPIEDGAIFVEELDHYEYIFTPNGTVSSRRDWQDREDECVMEFLREKYPRLDHHQ